MKSFCVKAPAKVNLFLHIVGKNRIGFHLIESLFVFTNFSDYLEINIYDQGFRYENSIVEFINSKFRINSRYNTVIKAVNLLLRYTSIQTKVIVKVIKNIPIAAGFGGGSSDAAAIIRTLGRLWKIDKFILNKIALNVGSDVPASIDSRPVFVKGIGEKLHPVERFFLPTNVVLVKVKKKFLSTSEVFSKYKGNFSKPIEWNSYEKGNLLMKLLKETKNDLQDIAVNLVPEIKDLILTLESQKGSILSRMSGSGVACFGIFDNKGNAKAAAENIKEKYPEWWVCNTQLIT